MKKKPNIKIIDLCVGDYVMYNGGIHKVSAIYFFTKSVDLCCVDTLNIEGLRPQGTNVSLDKLEPIPLTFDLLGGNGWKHGVYSTYKIDDFNRLEIYWYEHRLRRIYEGVDERLNHSKVKDITFQCQCFYLHEFQHAMRKCGCGFIPINIKDIILNKK